MRVSPLLMLLAVIALYFGTGVHFLYWPDSSGYLRQALTLVTDEPYARPSGRSVGYPLLLIPALSTAWPALSLVALQGGLVLVAYVLLYHHLTRAAPLLAPADEKLAAYAVGLLPIGLAASASYGGLHVLLVSLLPEILFSTLALVAVIAVGWFVLKERTGPWTPIATVLVSCAASLNLFVKPHWLLAAPFLGLVIGWKLAAMVPRPRVFTPARFLVPMLALLAPFLIMALVSWPERHLNASVNPEEGLLFGPRTVFCNHLHLIDNALKRDTRLRLHDDEQIDQAVRGYIADVRSRYTGGWKWLGFNGDLCTYDPALRLLIGRYFHSIEDQRHFYLNSLLRAALADPIPFASKVVAQIWYGLQATFTKFAPHYGFEWPSYSAASVEFGLSPSFLAGTTQAGEAGPLGSRAALGQTLPGKLIHAALAVGFTLLGVVYVGLFAASAMLGVVRWSRWPRETRCRFMAFVAVPMGTILAHHSLVALTHTFDVWRYAFDLFFVNLAFVAASSIFWWRQWSVSRSERRVPMVRPT